MKGSKSVERLGDDSPNFGGGQGSPATDVTCTSQKTASRKESDSLSWYKQRCEVLERDVSRLQSERVRQDRQLRQLQEANSLAAKNCNNTSSAFSLPSEFKSAWEEVVTEQILDAFDEYIFQPRELAFLVQTFFHLVLSYIDTRLSELVAQTAAMLRIPAQATSELHERMLPLFQEHCSAILPFQEGIGQILKSQFLEECRKAGALNAPNFELESLQQLLSTSEFAEFTSKAFKLCLHMQLNSPRLRLDLGVQRACAEKGFSELKQHDFDYRSFRKADFQCIDGFPKEESPCAIILPPPLLHSGYVFQGIKAGVIILQDPVSTEVQELVIQSREARIRELQKAKQLKRRNDILSDTVDVPKEIDPTLEKIQEEEEPLVTHEQAPAVADEGEDLEQEGKGTPNDSSILPMKQEESVQRRTEKSQKSSPPLPSPYLKECSEDGLPQTPKQFPQMEELEFAAALGEISERQASQSKSQRPSLTKSMSCHLRSAERPPLAKKIGGGIEDQEVEIPCESERGGGHNRMLELNEKIVKSNLEQFTRESCTVDQDSLRPIQAQEMRKFEPSIFCRTPTPQEKVRTPWMEKGTIEMCGGPAQIRHKIKQLKQQYIKCKNMEMQVARSSRQPSSSLIVQTPLQRKHSPAFLSHRSFIASPSASSSNSTRPGLLTKQSYMKSVSKAMSRNGMLLSSATTAQPKQAKHQIFNKMAQYQRILKKSASGKLMGVRGTDLKENGNQRAALRTEDNRFEEQLHRKRESMRQLQSQMLEKRVFKKRVVDSSSSSESPSPYGRRALVGVQDRYLQHHHSKMARSFVLKKPH